MEIKKTPRKPIKSYTTDEDTEYHRDADKQDTLIGADLNFVNRAGDKINVGWVKMPCVPRIGDKFECHNPAGYDPKPPYRWIESFQTNCIVTDVTFSNANNDSVFIVKVTITEVA